MRVGGGSPTRSASGWTSWLADRPLRPPERASRLGERSVPARPRLHFDSRHATADGGPAGASDRMNRFQKIAIAATASTFALIGVGALVRASGSGAGCGTSWPFCHGVDAFSYHALIEQSHRWLAFATVVLVGWLAVHTFRQYRNVRPLFRGAMTAVVLVVAQAALGGIVVKGDLKPTLVTAHLATAMLLAGTLVWLITTSFCNVKLADRGAGHLTHEPGFARLAAVTAAAGLALILVGGYVRGQNAGLAFGDWPLMNGKLVPQLGGVFTTMFLHRVLAAAVGVLVIYTCVRAWTMERRYFDMTLFSTLALGLYAGQVMVGATLVWSRLAGPAKVAHVVLASLIWGSLVALATTSRRLVGSRRGPAPADAEPALEPA